MSYINDLVQNNIKVFGIVIILVVIGVLVLINIWSHNIETRAQEGKKETAMERVLFWKLPWVIDNLPFTQVKLSGGVIVVALFGILVLMLALMGKLH